MRVGRLPGTTSRPNCSVGVTESESLWSRSTGRDFRDDVFGTKFGRVTPTLKFVIVSHRRSSPVPLHYGSRGLEVEPQSELHRAGAGGCRRNHSELGTVDARNWQREIRVIERVVGLGTELELILFTQEIEVLDERHIPVGEVRATQDISVSDLLTEWIAECSQG